MNLPNQLTVARLVLTFVFVALLSLEDLSWSKTAALLAFAIAAITDFLDGHIARKRNLVTNFGKLMDPLADKVLMCAGFVLLTRLELIPAWIVVVILSGNSWLQDFVCWHRQRVSFWLRKISGNTRRHFRSSR